MGKVIASFAGTGKTYLASKYPNIADVDLGSYRWVYDGPSHLPYEQRKAMRQFAENPKWPNNYMSAILDAKSKYDLVLVSSTPEISAIIDHNFIPGDCSWDSLEKRYRERGNPERFIELFKTYFGYAIKAKGVKMMGDEFLETALKREGLI